MNHTHVGFSWQQVLNRAFVWIEVRAPRHATKPTRKNEHEKRRQTRDDLHFFLLRGKTTFLLLCNELTKDSFPGALRPALATAGLIAYPVAGGILEAGVSHVFIFRL